MGGPAMPHKHRANHQHQPPHSGADAVKVTRTKRAASSPYPRTSSPEADAAQDEVRDELRALHADELAYLSQHWRASRVPRAVERSYTYLFWRTTRRYFLYLWQTWSRAMWSTFFLPTSECPVSRRAGGGLTRAGQRSSTGCRSWRSRGCRRGSCSSCWCGAWRRTTRC